MSTPLEVAVVGSGPSGLAAAFRLQQAGYRVRLFEANDYVGGKLRTSQRDGFLIDEGAGIMPSHYRNILGIAAEAGLGDEVIPGGSIIGFARDDRIHYLDAERLLPTAARFGLVSGRSKLVAARILLDAARLRSKLSFEDLSLAAGADTETAAAYAGRRLNQEVLDHLVNPTVRGLVGASADQVSVVDFLFAFSRFIGARFLAFRHGMGSYAHHIARRFDVELGARVVAVEQSEGDVSLTWSDARGVEQTERLAGCVLAVPASVSAGVHTRLDAWRRDFLRRVTYTTHVNVTVALGRAPASVPAFLINVPQPVHHGLIVITLDHNKAPGRAPAGKGLLGLYTASEWARQLSSEDDDVVVKEVVDAAERVLPGIGDDVEFATVHRWDPMVLRSRPGYWAELARFNQIRDAEDQLIQLAGDYFSCSNVNGATAAGERAARDLVRALAPGR
ncbi:MAG: protoporphyrinogen/coproporphyrinogen oxidase [Acidimicrobiia bacterium]